jgi:hypothetical protein
MRQEREDREVAISVSSPGRQASGSLVAGCARTLALLLCACCGPALASSLALVSDNGAKQVALFDTDLDVMTASRAAPPGRAVGDCALASGERLGFSSGSDGRITILDIDAAGEFSGRAGLVPISNLGVDMALHPEETYLVLAGGGALQQPLSVVDTRSRVEVATAGPFLDHTSVEFCDDGTLLVTTTSGRYLDQAPDNALYDAEIDPQGNLTLRGHRVASGAQPNNSACAPGSRAGVLLDRSGGLTSFTLPDLVVAERESTQAGAAAISAAFSSDGRGLYVRTADAVEAFDFDPVTGAMSRGWVAAAPGSLAYYGMEQIALHPGGGKLYVTGSGSMRILDPRTGAPAGSLPLDAATGICFARAAQDPLQAGHARIALPEAPAP